MVEVEEIIILTKPLEILLCYFTPRNSKQNKASLLEFPKLVLHSLEIPTPISKTRANSTWFFLDHLCIFLFLATGISTFYLEIPCPQPPPETKLVQPICWKNKHIQLVLLKWVGPLLLYLKTHHMEDLNSKNVQSLITMGKSFGNLFWSYNFRPVNRNQEGH